MEDMPDLRDVDVLLKEASDLSVRCATAMEPYDARDAFESALSIMLELRVPRMPETDEELTEMLRDAMDGPTFTSEETFARLKDHGRAFSSRLAEYRTALAEGDWQDAWPMIASSQGETLLTWNGLDVSTTVHGRTATIRAAGRDGITRTHVEECHAGWASALTVVLQAHVLWHDLWRR